MTTQAELDLQARLADMERQLAELGAKVNPLYSGGMDRFIHSGYLQWDGIQMRIADKGVDFIAIDSGDTFASVPNAARIRWLKDAFDGRSIGELAGGYATPTTFENNTVALRAFSDGWDSASIKAGVYDTANNDWLSLWQTQIAAGTSVAQVLFGKVIGGTQTILMSITDSDANATMYLRRNSTLLQVPVEGDGSELTIATGAITITTDYHRVDTQADAASDDLDTVNGGFTGKILVLRAENDARSVVAKDGTGNLKLAGDCTLDNSEDTLTLIYNGQNWLELARSNNGA